MLMAESTEDADISEEVNCRVFITYPWAARSEVNYGLGAQC